MIIDQKDCIKDIVVYEKKEKRKNGGILTKFMIGLPSKKEGYIHVAKGWNKDGFEDKLTKIPKGSKKFKRTKNRYSDKWAEEFYCKKPKTKKELKKEKTIKKGLVGSLHTMKWYMRSKKYWLKIKDFEKMKIGEKKDILMLDRNVWDVLDKFPKNKAFEPQKFFIYSKASFEYLGDMKIRLSYKVGKKKESDDVELHVNYKRGLWYPLKNGVLPAKDEQNVYTLLGKDKPWQKFKKDTFMGVRGPFIEWSNVKKLPKVYIMGS